MARGCFDDTKGAVVVKSLSAREPSALGLDTYCKQYYLCLAVPLQQLSGMYAQYITAKSGFNFYGSTLFKNSNDF